MAERTKQTPISPYRFPAEGLGVIAQEILGAPTGKLIYTSTKITVTDEKNEDGTSVIRKEIIRYDDAKGSNPVVIAKGSTKTGEKEFEFTSDASREERKNATLLKGASVGHANSLKKELDLNSEELEQFNKVNSRKNVRNARKEVDELESTENIGSRKTFSTNKKTRNKFPQGLVYPEELGNTSQDVIKFNMLEYSPRGFDAANFGFKDRRAVTKDKIIGSVILPIPGGISDKNACNWGESSMNAGQAVMGAITLAGIEGGFAGAGDVLRDIGKGIGKNTGDIKGAVANAFAGAATGTGGQLLTRTTGAIINPNLELLFTGPTLRPFQFQFRLSPRNKNEAKKVAKIIRFFKQGSAPIRGQNKLFLKSPHTFQLQYIFRGRGDDHAFLNKFKECALKSVSVNYTPDGSYSTYEDGAMTSYQVTLEFQELEPIFNDDYEDQKSASFRKDPAEQEALQSDIPSQIGF